MYVPISSTGLILKNIHILSHNFIGEHCVFSIATNAKIIASRTITQMNILQMPMCCFASIPQSSHDVTHV